MKIFVLPEYADYKPLETEPYRSFNRKYEDRSEDIDGAVIRLSIADRREGFTQGFTMDRVYCEDISLEFMFAQIPWKDEDGKDEIRYLIHHTISYDFDPSFAEFQQDMAEEMKARTGYFYIPGVKQLDFRYSMSIKDMSLIFDAVTDKTQLREVCNRLIGHDIAIFSRGW